MVIQSGTGTSPPAPEAITDTEQPTRIATAYQIWGLYILLTQDAAVWCDCDSPSVSVVIYIF